PRMRQKAEDAEASYPHGLRSLARAIPREMGSAPGISHGLGELREEAQRARAADRIGHRRGAALTPILASPLEIRRGVFAWRSRPLTAECGGGSESNR